MLPQWQRHLWLQMEHGRALEVGVYDVWRGGEGRGGKESRCRLLHFLFPPQFFLSNLLWLSLRPTLEPILYILWLFLGLFLLISPYFLAEQWPELMMTDLQGADSGFYMAWLKKVFSLNVGALLNKWIWPYCYRILKLGAAVLFYQSQPNCTDLQR